jgi:hypothetical protein
VAGDRVGVRRGMKKRINAVFAETQRTPRRKEGKKEEKKAT